MDAVQDKVQAALREVEKKIVQTRVALINGHPFFGMLSLRLQIIPDASLPTMAVDGVRLWYNPAWADALPFDELKGVLAHEVLHCGLGHPFRFNGRDHKTWNLSCDHVVNRILLEAGFALPAGGVGLDRNPEFDGKSAEEVYAVLWGRQKRRRQGQEQGQKPGQEQGQGQGQGEGESESEQGSEPKDGKGKGKSKGKSEQPQSKGEGQGSEGEADEAAPEDAADYGGTGSFSEPKGENGQSSKAACEEQAREWQVATSQAISVAKKAGDLPGSLVEILDGARKPEVDWRAQLRRFIDSASRQDYSWLPPNKRHIGSGLYLPSIKNDGLGEIVFAIDTSASMDSEALKLAVAELNSILSDLNPERVHVIQCDTRVNEHREIEAGNYPIKVDAKGRGGTEFKPVFDKVEALGVTPVCCIYFTDLYPNSGFPVEPDYPVLWTTPPNSGTKAPWGEIIKVLADGRE